MPRVAPDGPADEGEMGWLVSGVLRSWLGWLGSAAAVTGALATAAATALSLGGLLADARPSLTLHCPLVGLLLPLLVLRRLI